LRFSITISLTSITGSITADELGAVMKQLGLAPSDTELQDLINEADTNKDGVINFDGWSSLFMPP
jgi:calmodulin